MSWQDFFQKSLFKNNEMLLPIDRISIYLTVKTSDDGLIITTIRKASDATNISYSTTQKIFKELIERKCILKLQNGLYAPLLRITNMSEEEIIRIIAYSKIDNYIILSDLEKGEKFLCPRDAKYYLRKVN